MQCSALQVAANITAQQFEGLFQSSWLIIIFSHSDAIHINETQMWDASTFTQL